MDTPEEDNEHEGSMSSDKRLVAKIYALGGVIVLLAYGKFVWPLIYGRMRQENITFLEAVKDSSVHVTAFCLLLLAAVVGVAWGYRKSEDK